MPVAALGACNAGRVAGPRPRVARARAETVCQPPCPAAGQETSLVETRRTEITTDVASDVVEPWPAVNPVNRRIMLAAAMFPNTDSSAVYRAEDAGKTWTRSEA